jgi:DNA-binding MarR family transcriptional regulator
MGTRNSDARISLQTLRVLGAFLDKPSESLSGVDVRRHSGLATGTLYPILLRLESAGWFVSRWENADPSAVGRPRRRFYRLTPTALAQASEVFLGLSLGKGVPA